MRSRSRGFTLIELLVVIAIIAILAAMLFPVFARARESARKIQCLSNVKNVAIGFQIYLSDYDRFPPQDHDAAAEAYFRTEPGKGGGGDHEDCNHKAHANPYLRWPLVLDEYTKNRDVWRCPSAKLEKSARWIVPSYGPGGWLGYLQSTEGKWGRNNSNCETSGGGGPCCVAWPPGWGGSVTDSIGQVAQSGEDTGAFVMGIGTTSNAELKTSAIEDPSWFVVCADAGAQEEIWMASLVAMPDACRTGCGPNPASAGCCSADWTNCSDSQSCGVDWSQKATLFSDPGLQRPWTRHLGGSNIGFADGHASWMASGQIVSNSPTIQDTNAGKLRGMGCIIDFCG
jgi:prepilin-type N-terminal cleavage/methylation domain-containing protein/prepilin-type processing-associated H-X9-DG protein